MIKVQHDKRLTREKVTDIKREKERERERGGKERVNVFLRIKKCKKITKKKNFKKYVTENFERMKYNEPNE